MFVLLLAACSLDRVAPVVELMEPSGPVSGTASLTFVASDEDPGVGAATARVIGAGEAMVQDGTIAVDTTALSDGEHVVELTVLDGSLFGNATVATARLFVDNTPPEVDVHGLVVGQGRATRIGLQASEPLATLSVEAFGQQWVGDSGAVFLGVDVDAEVGEHPVTVRVSDLAGNGVQVPVTLMVEPVDYPSGGFIQLDAAQVAARQDDTSRADADAVRAAAYRESQGPASVTAVLPIPVEGARTSGFGKYRTYSDGVKQVHRGLDIAAPKGRAVVAPADGVVRFVGEQAIYGNVVIVSHGGGVATSYNHLAGFDVEVGQEVSAGDALGSVGSTGQSTGPHLHWSVAVGGVEVDPEQWVGGEGLFDP